MPNDNEPGTKLTNHFDGEAIFNVRLDPSSGIPYFEITNSDRLFEIPLEEQLMILNGIDEVVESLRETCREIHNNRAVSKVVSFEAHPKVVKARRLEETKKEIFSPSKP